MNYRRYLASVFFEIDNTIQQQQQKHDYLINFEYQMIDLKIPKINAGSEKLNDVYEIRAHAFSNSLCSL